MIVDLVLLFADSTLCIQERKKERGYELNTVIGKSSKQEL